MAEPTTVDNGSLTDYDVAVDDLGVDGVAGLAKLLVSADGSSARIPADAANGLDVDVTRVQGTVTVGGTVALSGTSPVSAASLPLPAGAATAAKQPALGVAGTPSSDVVSVQGVASGTVIPVSDGGGSLTVDGSVAVSGTVPVSDAGGTLSVDDGAGSLTVDGTVTADAGTGPWPVTDNGGSLTVDGTVAVSGTTAVSAAALPLPAGAATSAKQPALGTAGTASTDVVTVQGIASGTVLPVSDGGGSLTVDGTVAATQSGTWNVGTVTAVTNVVHVDDNSSTLSVDDGGGSLTVDGSVAVSGTVPVSAAATTVTLTGPTNGTWGENIDCRGAQWVVLRVESTGVDPGRIHAFGTAISGGSYDQQCEWIVPDAFNGSKVLDVFDLSTTIGSGALTFAYLATPPPFLQIFGDFAATSTDPVVAYIDLYPFPAPIVRTVTNADSFVVYGKDQNDLAAALSVVNQNATSENRLLVAPSSTENRLLNGVTSPTTGDPVYLDVGFSLHALQVALTGSPASAVVTLEGSIDKGHWVTLVTWNSATETSGDIVWAGGKLVSNVRGKVTTLSGGTSPTVTATWVGAT